MVPGGGHGASSPSEDDLAPAAHSPAGREACFAGTGRAPAARRRSLPGLRLTIGPASAASAVTTRGIHLSVTDAHRRGTLAALRRQASAGAWAFSDGGRVGRDPANESSGLSRPPRRSPPDTIRRPRTDSGRPKSGPGESP